MTMRIYGVFHSGPIRDTWTGFTPQVLRLKSNSGADAHIFLTRICF